MPKTCIISLGGSLIAPASGPDWKFLKKFKELILARTEKGGRFFIIAGGGAVCRDYQNAAKKIARTKADDLDRLGIQASRLNAYLLKTIFQDDAHPEIITNPAENFLIKKKIVIAGGWKPGNSTDYVAVLLAKKYKAGTVINLSNIDYVYDKDPKKFKDAKKIKSIGWKNFRKLAGSKWTPGLNTPFDPVASGEAEHLKLEVVIMNGKNLNNLRNCLEGKKIKGTIIL